MNALDASLGGAANDIRASPLPARANDTGGRAGSGAARCVADWLGLAAAPTFAAMALVAAVAGGGPADMLCGAARAASPLTGMVSMYLLMSAFHLAPWLRLVMRPFSLPRKWNGDRPCAGQDLAVHPCDGG